MQLFFTFVVLLVAIHSHPASCLDGDTFTVNCAPLTIQRSDPIITPGIASSHVHNIIGGNAFKRTMIGSQGGAEATKTTCNKATDHSNYWVPAMYHQRADKMWELVKWTGSAVYYQKRACNYSPTAKSCDKSFVPMAPPDGFRMVAGDPMRRTQDNNDFAQRAIAIMCVNPDGSKEVHGFPTTRCDSYMRTEVYFPSCWDGVNLDPPDHKSHMAYPAIGDYNGGVCPQSHPVAIFSIFYEFFFTTSPYPDINRFAFANGDPTGYGFHGDFIMGWTNRTALQHAHETCINAADCPMLGNQPDVPQTLIHPAIFEEPIGLNGTIASLPGHNPVVWPN